MNETCATKEEQNVRIEDYGLIDDPLAAVNGHLPRVMLHVQAG